MQVPFASFCVGTSTAAHNLDIPECELEDAIADCPAAHIHNGVVHMEAVENKMSNYLRFCSGWLSDAQKPSDPIEIIRRYTSEKGGFCYKINMGLATDHAPTLQRYAMDIRHLKFAIGKMGFKPRELIRGVDLADDEVRAMETAGTFYIPGFTSTSDGGGQFERSHLLVIDARDASWALKIRPEWTDYPNESEVLLTCYTKFRFEGKDETSNPQKIYLKVLKDGPDGFGGRKGARYSPY